MPEIKILKDTVCGGKLVKAGEVIEATLRETKILVEMGKAELAGGDAEIQNRDDDVKVSNRDPAPKAAMTTKSAKALKG